MTAEHLRRIAVVTAGVCLLGACIGLARQPNLVDAPAVFLGVFALAFASYVMGLWGLSRARGRAPLVYTLEVALGCRLVLLPSPPTLSTDAYRYVWDARVASAGFSPYAFAPWARELEGLRDQRIFPRLNHPTWRTIYPPAAQAFFRLVYGVAPDSVLAMKVAVGLAELATLAALVALLIAMSLPLWQAVIYAWNPLVLVEIWGSGHFDSLAVATVVGAALAAQRHRPVLAASLLGVGTLVKLYPAALLPLLLGRGRGPAVVAAFAAVVALGYVPLLGRGADVLGSLPRYMTDEYFNPGLARTLVDHPASSIIAALAWIGWCSFRERGAAFPARGAPLIAGLLVLSPSLFPWYVTWLVPFLAVTPSLTWIGFTGTIAFAYSFFLSVPWAIPMWARALEFAPLAAGAVWAIRNRAAMGARRTASGRFAPP